MTDAYDVYIKNQIKQQLIDTDYTQLADVKLSNKAAFDFYRQMLREAYKDPSKFNLVPNPPEPIWATPTE